MSDGHWQLEGSAAELYQRYLVPAITTKWAEDLVHWAQLRAGEDVLDVACGTGVVARLAAGKVTPGHVTGLDLNSGMLAIARSVPNEGEPVSWKEASALDLPFSSGHFDAVLCQLGLQFFPDQPKALREMRRVVRDSGRVALSVYSPIERTPGANTFVRALDEVLGPEASRIKRGEHSFASPAQMLVGGTRKALEVVAQDARAAGAERTTMLAVAVPSHTPLLAEASEEFRQALFKTHLPEKVPSDVRLLSGIDGDTVFDVHMGAEKLARQIEQTVNWAACMESCRAAGVTKVFELGPGDALARMMHEVITDGDVHSLSEFHSLSGFEHWVEMSPV